MPEKRNSPKAHAITLSKAWGSRFPVDVRQIALEISSRRKDPIAKIEALPIPVDEFEGALLRKKSGGRWGIMYSGFIREAGKINFTIAHELGHYELHRETEGSTVCSEDDMRDFARGEAVNIEQEANQFASYLLMPIDDYRRQVDGYPINLQLLTHCAERYATSLTASAIKLIEFLDRPVVVVVSKAGIVTWSRSSDAALKLGCFLRKGAVVPENSPTAQCGQLGAVANNTAGVASISKTWFESSAVRESALAQPHYGTVFTVLECAGGIAASRGPQVGSDEDPVRDAFDHFTSFSDRREAQ